MTRRTPGTPVLFITNAQSPRVYVPAEPGDAQDWVNLSHRLARVDTWLTLRTQGIGFLDLELRARNADMQADVDVMTDAEKVAHAMSLTAWQFASELWTMSAYELVRHVNANLGSLGASDAALRNRWASLKKAYESIRIPLAKFRGTPDTPGAELAYAVVPGSRGAGWIIGDVLVWRDDLAADLREAIRACPSVDPESLTG